MSLNLNIPLRDAVLAHSTIPDQLAEYEGEPAVFTRRPIPTGASYPLIWIGPDAASGSENFINNRKPTIIKDVGISGEVGAPGHPNDQYRLVETIAYDLWDYFDDRKDVVSIDGFNIMRLTASTPIPGPSDDDRHITRIVTLTFRLSENT